MRGDRLSVGGERVFCSDHSEIDALREINMLSTRCHYCGFLSSKCRLVLLHHLCYCRLLCMQTNELGDHLPTLNDVSFFVTFTTARGALVEL